MIQSTSFLMRKYRTASLIMIREKHSLRETVIWAQKTLFRVMLGEVSSLDRAKFKPETNIQVMDFISDGNYSKFGQFQAKDICIPLNSAFWNKDEFNNKMQHSSQTENCPFTLGPTICIENVNERSVDDICSRSNIVQVQNYLVSAVANPHWFVKYVKSCNAEEFDQRKFNYGNVSGKVQLHSIATKYQSNTS